MGQTDSMSAGGSKQRIAGMDRWLVGLARLPTASFTHRLLVGAGFALLGLATLGLALATLHAVVSLAAAVEASRHKA